MYVTNCINGVQIFSSSCWTHNNVGEYVGIYTPTKDRQGKGKTRRLEGYGKVFKTNEEMDKYDAEKGYIVRYYGRPNLFIQMRLSPRTRKYLKNKPIETIREFLQKIDKRDYVKAVFQKTYMEKQLKNWMHYIRTGGQDLVFHADKWKGN